MFLVRTDQSHFPIDPKLEYETTKMHNVPIDVSKSMLTGSVLSFRLPTLSEEVFHPLSTIYDYFVLNIVCLLAGLTLWFYPKYNDNRMYIVFLSIVAVVAAAIPMIATHLTIESIYSVKTIGW